MRELPSISETQKWCCGTGGCGECQTRPTLREYSRTEHPNGNVDSMSERIFVSACCGGDLLLWDEDKQDCVDWNYVEITGGEHG